MLSTVVVPNRDAWRHCRTEAASAGLNGRKLYTIDQLAARLVGGFIQPIDSEVLADAVLETLENHLGELDPIKRLPGFRRAASSSLSQAWSAGLSLDQEAKAAQNPAARSRLMAMSQLETGVLAILRPKCMLRPSDLVAAALPKAHLAKILFGTIEIVGRTEMSPVWRPLLAELANHVEIVWVAEARPVPAWLASTGVPARVRAPEKPSISTYSCASPHHEILEAFRWVRRLLAQGVPAHDIAITTSSPANWDDPVLALSDSANIAVHFVHGRAALNSGDGQLCAALAEVLLRGFSQPRMKRLITLLGQRSKTFSGLDLSWWKHLPEDLPMLDAERWTRELAKLTPESFSDGVDQRPLLHTIIDSIGLGLERAIEVGTRLLTGPALAIWQKALREAPPAALDVTLGGLRIDDGLEPAACVVWAPAAALAATPRRFTWMVGLTSRSWPRRASEDPLLPDHVIAAHRLDPLPVHEADRRDFQTIMAMTGTQVVCSRARRDSGGRINGLSPLYPRDVPETYLAQSRQPEYAASSTDRLFARPQEFDAMPEARSALSAWIDWHTEAITPHDGLVRSGHPVLLQALDRSHSASSLAMLLRNPLGYLWKYGFRWSEPEETEEPLNLDALAFGSYVHKLLETAVGQLERKPDGYAAASPAELRSAIEAADLEIAAVWEDSKPIPPPVIWHRKRREAIDLALAALLEDAPSLSDQQSYAEVQFGLTPPHDLDPSARSEAPWDRYLPVIIPGTDLRITGTIDRVDLAGDRTLARVTDYKTGKLPKPPPQLNGGAELQRCLYAYAVRSLIGNNVDVEARLLYARSAGKALALNAPEETLEKLSGYLVAALAAFKAGKSLPGPSAGDAYDDFAFALPGGAKQSYLDLIAPLVAEALSDLAPLWEEE